MLLANETLRESSRLTIFVHRASECLTDHLSHGDGLICFALLYELTKRGHRVFAYTNRDGVRQRPDGMTIRARLHRVPANSLAPWEHGLRANSWLREIERDQRVDIVWRMHPYNSGCPTRPYTGGRPLVVGPLFYSWPKETRVNMTGGRPRLGVGVGPLVAPLADRGWNRTLRDASLVLCATRALADRVSGQTGGKVATLPVIIDPPADVVSKRVPRKTGAPLKLLFVANLHPNKNPLVFCQTIERLREIGIEAMGRILGDGDEKETLQQYCRQAGLEDVIRFGGRIANSEVYRYLSDADCLVSTSLGEPYGRSIAEAMSVGAVPICHRSGGPADFISHRVDGLLVDQLNGESFARAIAETVADVAVQDRLSQAAMEKARHWKPEEVVGELESALLQLVEGRQAPVRMS
jgi:glycosyltransferase involved in cell wall biosynthesis